MKFLARAFFCYSFLPLIWLIYRIRRIGRENVPRQGGVLLLSNHVSYIDSFVIYLSCPRPVRFVVLESYTQVKGIAWFLRLFGAIPIRPENAREAIVRTVEALEAGDVVCLFPEGGLTRLGVTTEFKKGFELIVRKADCPVVPVYMDGLFESIFSFERGRYFKKRPQSLVCPLRIAFGPPIPPGEATTDSVRLGVWEQASIAFAQRREFRRPLEVAAVRALKRRRGRVLFAEYGRDDPRLWTRAQTLALAVSIARRWMAHSSEEGERIGILLPPGPMASVIHLGLVLAGRTPVNLPFTVDPREIEAAAKSIAPLGIRTVVTSRAFMPKLVDFWQGDEGGFVDLKALIPSPGSLLTLFERARAVLEPAWLTCWRLDLSRRDPDREVVGLVSSPGDEAVFLSARELHRDIRRVQAANFVRRDDVVFTEDSPSLPEGLVFGCWGAILGRGSAVSRSLSQRDDAELLDRALREQEATLVTGSAAFFQSLDHASAAASVKYGLVFGPVAPQELRDSEERLGFPLCRAWSGHGRVLALSRPDPDIEGAPSQKGNDPESVGHLLPGFVGKVEKKRLRLRLSPEGAWLPGPKGEIAPEGLVHLHEGAGKRRPPNGAMSQS